MYALYVCCINPDADGLCYPQAYDGTTIYGNRYIRMVLISCANIPLIARIIPWMDGWMDEYDVIGIHNVALM